MQLMIESKLKTIDSVESASYHYNKFFPASAYLGSLIISAESTACRPNS